MKILMLVNWRIEYCDYVPDNKQSPDYYISGNDYWFFKYFKNKPDVDVIDIHSFSWLEKFECDVLHFYIIQAIRAIPKLNKYDLIISHGMQSGVVISLWRRLFGCCSKHLVFDIGSFASGSRSGMSLKLMQFASKSIDRLIYHTSSQIEYYKNYFPWIVSKCNFVRFGTDVENISDLYKSSLEKPYIVCVGYKFRDWNTAVEAYKKLNTDVGLKIIGHVDNAFANIPGIEQISYVSFKDLFSQIINAVFCVLPLKWYNFSYGQITLIQQMLFGKCIITARVPSIVDYIKDGETAILYEPENIDDLCEKISQCIENKVNIARIGQNARDYALNFCSERIMAQNIEQIIYSL